jgi:hypothetical protein
MEIVMFIWYWNVDGKSVFFDFDPSEFLTDLVSMGSLLMLPFDGWNCE